MPTWMWLDLRKLLGEVPDKLDTESDETYSKRLMRHERDKHLKNPQIVDEFFFRRVANFLQHFFGPNGLETVWTWYQIEWQKRGDPHVHGNFVINRNNHLFHSVFSTLSNAEQQESVFRQLFFLLKK